MHGIGAASAVTLHASDREIVMYWLFLLLALGATRGKKSRKQLATFFSQNTADDLGMVVQALDGKEIDHAAMHAGFQVACAINNT